MNRIKIYKELSSEYNLPIGVLRELFHEYTQTIANELRKESDTDIVIKIPYIGKFLKQGKENGRANRN